VTTVLILIISLIVIGFSQVARRNQREALDRQLSTQAFYAAESGVNAAVAVIRAKVANGGLPDTKNTCGPDVNYPAVQLDGTQVRVTCLLVDSEVDSLFYTAVTENSPTVVPVISANGTPISKLTLTWRSKSGGATPSSNCTGGGFTTRGAWLCGQGVLRTDLAALPNGNTDSAMSTFFNPQLYGGTLNDTTAPTVDYNSRGGLITAYCVNGADPRCMASITNLNRPVYYMNLRSIYRDSTVSITGVDAGGNRIDFTGQVMIDSTARAQDVLRRIQVRVPMSPRESSNIPAYGIETSDTLCKRYAVEPGYYASDPANPCP
jgi:hypothetical protein